MSTSTYCQVSTQIMLANKKFISVVVVYYMYFYHNRPKYNLRGLMANPEKSITMIFHCIIPKLLWEWDETSCMYMRFENSALGNWRHNIGEFKLGRYVH